MSAVIKGLLAEKLHNEPSIVTIQRDISEKFRETDRKLQMVGAMLAAMAEQQLILETYLEIVSANVLDQQYRGRTMPADIRTFIENMPGKMKTNTETMEKLDKLICDFNKTQEGSPK